MEPSDPSRRGRVALVSAALVLAGVLLVLYATAVWGPIVTWDSLVYVGFIGSSPADAAVSALFAPLFPLMLAGLQRAGLPMPLAVRVLHSALFGGLVALSVFAGARYARGKWAFAIAGFLILASATLLEQFSRVMSEPLALCAGFGGLLSLAVYLEGRQRRFLVLAAVGFALAIGARYASVPFLAAGCIALAFPGQGPRPGRFRDAALLGSLPALALLAWLVRNAIVTGGALHRSLTFHPPAVSTIGLAAAEISSWILPHRVPAAVRIVALGILVAAWIGLSRATAGSGRPARPDSLGRLLGLFALCYAAFLFFVTTFVDASVTVGTRHLLPLYVAALWALARVVDRGLAASAPSIRRWTAVGTCLFLAASGASAGAKAFLLHRDGDGYGGRVLQTSVIRRLALEPLRGRLVYAADPDMVRYVSGVEAIRFPSRFDPMTQIPNPDYPALLESVKGELRSARGVTVRLAGGAENRRFPPTSELEEPLHLTVVAQDRTALIYGSTP